MNWKDKVLLFSFYLISTGWGLFAQVGIKGTKIIEDYTQEVKGNAYAVIIGISDYQNMPKLRYADKDARAFYDFLRSNAGGKIDSSNIKLLLNHDATGIGMNIAIYKWLRKEKKPKANDRVYIYFSGHGDADDDQVSYLLGQDVSNDDPDVAYKQGSTLQIYDLKQAIKTMVNDSINVFLITDACRGGELKGGKIGRETTETVMNSNVGEIQLSSCSADEYSQEDLRWGGGRGVFSWWLINGLYGLADRDNTGWVSIGDLKTFVSDSVRRATKKKQDNGTYKIYQNPYFSPGRDNEQLFMVDTVKKRETMSVIAKYYRADDLVPINGTRARGIKHYLNDTALTDSVKAIYKLFKSRIDKNILASPADDCAYYYFTKLEKLKPRDNFYQEVKDELVIALANKGQQVMNDYISDKLMLADLNNAISDAAYCMEITMKLISRDDFYYTSLNRSRLILEARKMIYSGTGTHYSISPVLNSALAKLDSASANLAKPLAIILHTKGLIFYGLVNYPKALEYESQAIKIAPRWAYPCNQIGLVFKKLNNFDSAEHYFHKALELDSTYSLAVNNLGSLYMEENQMDKAEPYLNLSVKMDSTYRKQHQTNPGKETTSVTLDSNSAIPISELGEIYMVKEDYNKAQDLLLKAIELDSTDIYNLYKLACINSILFHKRQALQYFERAVRLGYRFYTQIQEDNQLKNFRDTPEFKAIMKKYFPNDYKD